MFSSIFPIGGIVGPVLGGLAVTYWSWRSIFLINIPIGLVLVVVGLRFLPRSESLARDRRTATDVRGAVLLATTLLSGMYAVSALGSDQNAWAAAASALSAVAAVLAGAAFWRRASRHPNAFVPVRLLRGRGFLVLNVINVLAGATIFGFGGLVPLYAADRYGLSALQSSTLLTFRAIGMILVAALSAMALRRSGYRLPMALGFGCLAVGSVGTWADPLWWGPHAWLALCAGISGVGMGMSLPASNNAGFQLAPTEVAAIAGLRGMFRQSGGIIAVSVVTAFMAQRSDPSRAQADAFLLLGIVLALTIPAIRRVPDRRGGW
jgi:MFS family permease